jgi:multiple sugar transport system substrate-binding protein
MGSMAAVSRRRFVAAAGVSLAAGSGSATLLASCGVWASQEPELGKGGQPATIRTFEWAPRSDGETMQAIIDAYHTTQGRVRVQLEQPTGDYYEKLQATLVGGDAPDHLNMQTWRWQPFAAKGSVLPLDTLRERDKWATAWPKEWDKLYDPQTKLRGKLWARPYNMGGMVMFYAKDVFAKAGVPAPTDDWTYDQFVDAARRLTRRTSDETTFGYQTNTSYERLASWMRLHGEKEWDREDEPRKAQWTLASVVEALQFQVYDVFHTLKVSPTAAEMQGGVNRLQDGNVAMKVEGPWFLPSMWGPNAKNVPFEVALLPKGRRGGRAHMAFGHVHTLNAQTKAKDAAWDFMKFVGGEKAQGELVRVSGRQPITPEFNHRFFVPMVKQQFNFQRADVFVKAFDTGIVHLTGEVDDLFVLREGGLRDALNAMAGGEKKAVDVIPDVQRRIQQLLDEHWAQQGKK